MAENVGEESEASGVSPEAGNGRTLGKRKHRAGLQRVQIACERCRSRKNKCDRKLPECSTCKAAGAVCIVVDRLTNRQYPRGHVEGLEAEVRKLNARIEELELEARTLKADLGIPRIHSTTTASVVQGTPFGSEEHRPTHESSRSPVGTIAEDLSTVSRDVTRGQRYVGESSGLFFGNIVQAVLLHAGYNGEEGPTKHPFQLRTGDSHDPVSTTHSNASPLPSRFEFPDPELAHRLQNAYFTHRWPALPFMHRTTFMENHFAPSMSPHEQASDTSMFLTIMIFALGAIDVKRQNPSYANKHLEYFRHATRQYLQGLLEEDSIETIQGLLLIAQFAVNEHESANAWQVSGQAVRTAVDLGLHRNNVLASSSESDMLNIEMRRRVFWSTYALDRNISITLGRPCAIRDEDIDTPLPQKLRDEDLAGSHIQLDQSLNSPPQPLDMSTFIHIIRLRQLQSKIQALFYSANTSQVHEKGITYHQAIIRAELDEWIARLPRYSKPTMATFQSTEWFQIAYSHALLLLYRPSPASPIIDATALQICADSAISLISSYSSLYAKNKITYTWIALHSLFMASITMLYTLYVSPEIRASTTKAVVKSNIVSCLALFKVMSEHWPISARCHDIIERLGNATVALFNTCGEPATVTVPGFSSSDQSTQQHFGQIGADFLDWFGTRASDCPPSFSDLGGGLEGEIQLEGAASSAFPQSHQSYPDIMGSTTIPIEDFLSTEFDLNIPIMMHAFGNDPDGSHAPRNPDVSDASMHDLPSM